MEISKIKYGIHESQLIFKMRPFLLSWDYKAAVNGRTSRATRSDKKSSAIYPYHTDFASSSNSEGFDQNSALNARQAYDIKIGAHTLLHSSPSKGEGRVGVRQKRFVGLSSKTLKTTAIGMLISGLVTFLTLSFLPKKPSGTRVTSDELVGAGFKPAPTEPLAHEKVDISKAEVYYQQGIDYVKDGKLHEAIGEFEKAIEINPESFHAHAYLGFTYDAEGRLDEAIHEYEKAISINPDFAAAYYGLAAIYNKKGMFDRAERELEIYKWLTGRNTK